jgi:hypothetical protein
MPNKPKTQHRSVRIGDDDWRDLLAAAKVQGTDRAGAINELIAWYLRRPGATMPKRPEVDAWKPEHPVSSEEKTA